MSKIERADGDRRRCLVQASDGTRACFPQCHGEGRRKAETLTPQLPTLAPLKIRLTIILVKKFGSGIGRKEYF